MQHALPQVVQHLHANPSSNATELEDNENASLETIQEFQFQSSQFNSKITGSGLKEIKNHADAEKLPKHVLDAVQVRFWVINL